MPKLVRSIADWQRLRASGPVADARIGFVPTMGALHHGHGSLLQRSKGENDVTVLSVFLNPTQFDREKDLAAYPVDLSEDRRFAGELGVDYLFCPSAEEMYPDGFRYRVVESELSRRFCGASRPGHFDGVLTVVLKLLQLVRPTRAYFGKKDHQQLALVRGLAEAFFLPVEIVGCGTVREDDGLAASSRNALLSPKGREIARRFPALLAAPGSPENTRHQLVAAGFQVDYVEDDGDRRLGAVRLGDVRLIDNVEMGSRVDFEEAPSFQEAP